MANTGAIGAGIGGAVGGPLGALAGWGISKLFGGNDGPKDPTSYTALNGGKAPGPGGLATEGIDNSQDSLTQYDRSLTNLTGQTGKDTFAKGQRDTQTGLDRLDPVQDYFHRLISGDRSELASAMQPEADTISQQFGQIRQMFSTTGSRGGGTTSTIAQSPFEEIRQLTDLIARERVNAAGAAGQLALGEAGVGQGEAGIGANMLASTQQALLGRRGQNFQVDTANRQMLTNGLETVLGSPLSDLTGAGLHKALF